MGGGAGGNGTLYLLFLKPCDFTQEPGFNRWARGNVLFSNWNHMSQMLISDSLTFEQCTFKAFEADAAYMTYNFNDGRCICMDSTATLAASTELSNAYSNGCFSSANTTHIDGFYAEPTMVAYPNPTTSKVLLEITEPSFSGKASISLYNTVGKALHSTTIDGKHTSIDLSSYPTGVYFLSVSVDGVLKTIKIMKE